RRSIETVFYTIKKGKVIIRRGDEVTTAVVNQIEEINTNLMAKPSWLISFLGTFILFVLLFFALFYYLRSRHDAEETLNRFIMTAFTLLISLLLYKISSFMADILSENSRITFFSFTESYRYAFPMQMATLLFTYLSGVHLAIIITILNGILVGYLFKANFYLMVFVLLTGVAAIWGVRYLSRRSQTPALRAGILFVAPINALIIAMFQLLRGGIGPTEPFLSELFMGILGGIISAALAFLFLPLYEQVFGIVTQNRLLALTNSDMPILRSMAMAAPGSYHHSLIVASLGEAAAEDIGLDPLLVKAGALYHDIGKIKRPEYFIENRTRNFDLHKDLKPSMSVLVIINHVKEGVEQAKKLHLPKKIKDIIGQHHGTSLVRYFFEKAKVEYDPEMQNIGEESYRYAGPKPASKEAAVVMLADSVEAASRSLNKPTKSNLKRLITEIIDANIQDGQLDDSNLSIKELKLVANSFLSTLYPIYHPRVEYPGFDFEGQKARTNSNHKSNGRNSKPTKKT
ncbi:MAG: HDIG domain-containing protein, partial [Candidatus Aminicenantes bacterium]|nr:HDIG domain-containing protein [Candidatus Aminicenantes bacterium]